MKVKSILVGIILLTSTFFYGQGLVISEIHYNPSDVELVLGDDLEFIEVTNLGTTTLNIEGYSFTLGITYVFPLGTTIDAGESIVLAKNKVVFDANDTIVALGQYTGGLKNSGETIVLADGLLNTLVEVTYDDATPWPILSDGLGYSLELIDADNPDDGSSWVSSTNSGGTPGTHDADRVSISYPIIVNEILANTAIGETEKIELYNSSDSAVNIALWFLTDDRKDPFKYQFRPNTTIEAGEYLVLTSDDFGSDFSLSSKGEEVFIFSSYSSPSPQELWGTLSGFSNGMSYNVSDVSQSFGWHTTSDGLSKRFNLKTQTFGAANDVPVVGPLVFTDIMYAPDLLTDEFLIIKNISDTTVSTNSPYLVDSNAIRINGIGFKFDFTTPTTIEPDENILLTFIDPETFRTKYSIESDVQIFQYTGSINNVDELLEIEIPIKRDTLSTGEYDNHFKTIDEVHYYSTEPWPIGSAGNGMYLQRITDSLYANDPLNWMDQNAPVLGIFTNKFTLNNTVHLYPNVTDGTLTLSKELNDASYKIVSVTGEYLQSGTFDTKIDVSVLQDGMYIITIQSTEGLLSQRFIKK